MLDGREDVLELHVDDALQGQLPSDNTFEQLGNQLYQADARRDGVAREVGPVDRMAGIEAEITVGLAVGRRRIFKVEKSVFQFHVDRFRGSAG